MKFWYNGEANPQLEGFEKKPTYRKVFLSLRISNGDHKRAAKFRTYRSRKNREDVRLVALGKQLFQTAASKQPKTLVQSRAEVSSRSERKLICSKPDNFVCWELGERAGNCKRMACEAIQWIVSSLSFSTESFCTNFSLRKYSSALFTIHNYGNSLSFSTPKSSCSLRIGTSCKFTQSHPTCTVATMPIRLVQSNRQRAPEYLHQSVKFRVLLILD